MQTEQHIHTHTHSAIAYMITVESRAYMRIRLPSQRGRWAMEPCKRERTLNSKFNLIVQQHMNTIVHRTCARVYWHADIAACRRTVTKTLHEAKNHSTRNPYEYFMHSNNMNRLRFIAADITSAVSKHRMRDRSAVAQREERKKSASVASVFDHDYNIEEKNGLLWF